MGWGTDPVVKAPKGGWGKDPEVEPEEIQHGSRGASGDWGYPDPGPLRALATKLNEGLTKKASDELVGLVAKTQLEPDPGRYLRLSNGREMPARTPEEAQLAFREGERENQAAAEQHWPKLSFVADTAGEILGDTALAGSRMVAPAYQAAMGGLRGYFGTNSDDARDKAVGAGAGTLLGYGFSKIPDAAAYLSETPVARAIAESGAGKKAGEVLMSAARWPGEALRRVGARRATSAAGLIKSDLARLPPGADVDMGNVLLDRGAIQPFRTAEELRPGITEARQAAGKEIGAVHSAADAVSGGSGAEVRRSVAERRLADQNMRDAWGEAEGMRVDAAQTRAAEDIAARNAFIEKEKDRLLSNSLVTGKDREALAGELAETAAAKEFGDRGTKEAFRRAGVLPPDIVRDRIRPTPPQDLTKGLGFDAHGFIDSVEQRLLPELGDPALKSLKSQVRLLLSGYRQRAANGVSHAEANTWKTNLQKTISKFQDAPISQEAKIKLQSILDDDIEKSIGAKLGPGVVPGYRDSKSAYGLLKEAQRANRHAIARAQGNNTWGLTELLAMGAGSTAGAAEGSLGAAIGGPALALGAHVLKHRGASTAAVAARGLGNLALDAVENAPQLFGEFGSVIAGQKSPEARAEMAHDMAIRFPKFAEMLRALDDDATQPTRPDRQASREGR